MKTILSDDRSPALTPAQVIVIEALAEGSTISDAAVTAKVSRTTVWRWIKTIPQFRAAVSQAAAEHAIEVRDRLKDASDLALNGLLHILAQPALYPASAVIRAATFVLTRSILPGSGWILPDLVLEPGAPQMDSAALEASYHNNPLLAAPAAAEIPEPIDSIAVTPADPFQNPPHPGADGT